MLRALSEFLAPYRDGNGASLDSRSGS